MSMVYLLRIVANMFEISILEAFQFFSNKGHPPNSWSIGKSGSVPILLIAAENVLKAKKFQQKFFTFLSRAYTGSYSFCKTI